MEAPTPSDVNLLAVCAAAFVVLLLALAWYRPRVWVHAKGRATLAIVVTIAIAFFAVLTQAIVEVAHSPHYWDPTSGRRLTWVDGARGAAFIWAAWAMPPLAGLSAWGERSWRDLGRDASFLLVALLVSGVMTSMWTRSG